MLQEFFDFVDDKMIGLFGAIIWFSVFITGLLLNTFSIIYFLGFILVFIAAFCLASKLGCDYHTSVAVGAGNILFLAIFIAWFIYQVVAFGLSTLNEKLKPKHQIRIGHSCPDCQPKVKEEKPEALFEDWDDEFKKENNFK